MHDFQEQCQVYGQRVFGAIMRLSLFGFKTMYNETIIIIGFCDIEK